MSSKPRPWAPPGAASDPRIVTRTREAVDAWAARWLGRRRLVASGWRTAAVSDRAAPQDGDWRASRGVVAVHCPARGKTRLLEWALDVSFERDPPNDADLKVLDAFLGKALDDLAAALDDMLGAAGKAADDGGADDGGERQSLDLADANGVKLLSLTAPLWAFVALRKALAGAPAPRRAPLVPILTAAADAEIRLDVVLGRARAGLADVRNLAAGDVLVLATPLAGEILLAAPSGAVAATRLVEHEGRRALTLQSIVKERV
ncbi:FliM/FliN family flagellar motor C-terminal domain-containing protein [Caulobacter sp. CCNWLY153]|uniref:FliM/FliN family flagellar motor C-terminal domain-containing protein n=1 Tax=unclassified Caulobacter TaxID=2648921 RepID=UPI002FF0DDAB